MKVVCWISAIAVMVFTSHTATAQAATIPVLEDVMTSAFFTSGDFVRGYPGDNRPTMRVASDNAFGTGPETIYLTFDASHFASYSGPVPSAILQVESVAGGFNADATPSNPFQMSAHAVTANPITSITDNTNPGGAIAWNTFFTNNILPANPAAITTVTGFGIIQFDVTGIVNDWISGANSVFAIALTGKHDTLSDGDVLHGICNNNNTTVLGTTFISVVPEPATALLGALALAGIVVTRIHRRSR